MTREPLHYWRRRRGRPLGAFVHQMRLMRIYPLRIVEPIFADSKLFDWLSPESAQLVFTDPSCVGRL